MSYGIYIGKNHSATGHAWLGGYGDEPSSHWLEIVPETAHRAGAMIEVGVGAQADLPGVRSEVPQVARTLRHIRVSYSYYMGVPAPITNGGLNARGVAVRDIWSTSRRELVEMTPKDQRGLNYSDLARVAMERASSARQAVEICADLIARYGEASYGGNSHIFADADEAWVVIQFAGGQGLWVAERLGADSIRASRPGYVLEVPVAAGSHPDFMWSPNFVSFARDMGWYQDGVFDANQVYGDGKGRWAGVGWIETQMVERAARPEKIGLADMFWAVRCSQLTGDTAGYGQVVPLSAEAGPLMLWHAPVGAVASPFAPVFLDQTDVPPEFAQHRYLTVGESHRFMDMRKAVTGGIETVSGVPQSVEASRSAVYECKRLMYLMQLSGEATLARVTASFVAREGLLAGRVATMVKSAKMLITAGDAGAAATLLTYVSTTELCAGLDLVIGLATGLEAELRAGGSLPYHKTPQGFTQIW